MNHLTDQDPDIFLVSDEGVKVGTHRIVLKLFSPVLSDLITQSSEKVSHISVPASGSVLKNLVNTLNTGVTITRDRGELSRVAEVSDILGLGYVDWQIGAERKKKQTEDIKVDNEFVFEDNKTSIKKELESVVIEENKENNHEDRRTNNRFSCDLCSKTFTARKGFRKHQRVVHGATTSKLKIPNATKVKSKDFSCELCESAFKTKKYLKRHVKDIHEVIVSNDPKETCKECNKVHVLNAKDDEHHMCDLCNNKFYGKKLLQKHRSATHGIRSTPVKIQETYDAENPNHCHECKEACKSPTDLIYHQDTKHVDGTSDFLNCRFCDRKTRRKQKGAFREHLRTHTGESPEICSYCGQSFKQKKALKNHERLHTGEKPYKCEFCFAAFTQQNGLSSHQKSKSGCKMELA